MNKCATRIIGFIEENGPTDCKVKDCELLKDDKHFDQSFPQQGIGMATTKATLMTKDIQLVIITTSSYIKTIFKKNIIGLRKLEEAVTKMSRLSNTM